MSQTNTDVPATLISIQALLNKPLTIPAYQRPYKWEVAHVNQLIDDLLRHREKTCYQLGTVVLFNDSDKPEFDVVDGQQRLLTLTLLHHFLDPEHKHCKPTLLESGFESTTSQRNIRHNAAVVKSRVEQLEKTTRDSLRDFLLKHCQMVAVTLTDLSEAFQFFDSQNSRGKSLAPHDLLKAFHLREMQGCNEAQKKHTVSGWEADIAPEDHNTPALHRMMADYLYPIRRWTQGDSGLGFDKRQIGCFKGVNLQEHHYPWVEALKATDCMVAHYNAETSRRWDQQQRSYPFQLDQPMINGTHFFTYVQHYIALWKSLFVDELPALKALRETIHSPTYQGRHRVGDHYVRKLFYCAVLYYYDRFGQTELERAANLCFRWAYRIRLEKQRVTQESIDNAAKGKDSLIRAIGRAQHPHEVLSVHIENPTSVNASNVKGLASHFPGLKEEDK